MPTTDVLIVGAGPAGSIAALTLARAGVRTILVEAKRFPRDKVCGDGLIPDSLALLEEVGLLSEVEAIAHPVTAVQMIAPRGRCFTLRAPFLTLRRRHLDALLAEAATRAGAELVEGVTIIEPLCDRGVVVGARGRSDRGSELSISASITILATGAAAGMLKAFGVAVRTRPSGLAMRGYYRAPHLPEQNLVISWERPVLPGYGWVFPMGNGEANVGVGIFLDGEEVRAGLRARFDSVIERCPPRVAALLRDAGSLAEPKVARQRRPKANLRTLFKSFTESCPRVGAILRDAVPITEPKGAPLRCDFDGARPLRPGLLVAGEGIGTTYGFSGEGIGKAMESGRMAAQVAAGCTSLGRFDVAALGGYVDAMNAAGFPERFRRYHQAQRWMAHPLIVDLLARRASESDYVTQLLEGVIREQRSPDELLSLAGILRAMVHR